MKGIILHGGRGTRVGPLSRIGPKQLIPVANKAVSQYVLEDILACGISDIGMVLGDCHPEREVEERLRDLGYI
ncbi:MAG: sugar phosphate nucleotidyltransferase [Thermoplasmata archaeon]